MENGQEKGVRNTSAKTIGQGRGTEKKEKDLLAKARLEATRSDCKHEAVDDFVAVVSTRMGPIHARYAELKDVKDFVSQVLACEAQVYIGLDTEGHLEGLPPGFMQLSTPLPRFDSLPISIVFQLHADLKDTLTALFSDKRGLVTFLVYGKETETKQLTKYFGEGFDLAANFVDLQEKDAKGKPVALESAVEDLLDLKVEKWAHMTPDYKKSVWKAFEGSPPLNAALVQYAALDAHANWWIFHERLRRRVDE